MEPYTCLNGLKCPQLESAVKCNGASQAFEWAKAFTVDGVSCQACWSPTQHLIRRRHPSLVELGTGVKQWSVMKFNFLVQHPSQRNKPKHPTVFVAVCVMGSHWGHPVQPSSLIREPKHLTIHGPMHIEVKLLFHWTKLPYLWKQASDGAKCLCCIAVKHTFHYRLSHFRPARRQLYARLVTVTSGITDSSVIEMCGQETEALLCISAWNMKTLSLSQDKIMYQPEIK